MSGSQVKRKKKMRRQGSKRKKSEDEENKTNMHLNWNIRSIIRKKKKKKTGEKNDVCVCMRVYK